MNGINAKLIFLSIAAFQLIIFGFRKINGKITLWPKYQLSVILIVCLSVFGSNRFWFGWRRFRKCWKMYRFYWFLSALKDHTSDKLYDNEFLSFTGDNMMTVHGEETCAQKSLNKFDFDACVGVYNTNINISHDKRTSVLRHKNNNQKPSIPNSIILWSECRAHTTTIASRRLFRYILSGHIATWYSIWIQIIDMRMISNIRYPTRKPVLRRWFRFFFSSIYTFKNNTRKKL